MTTGTRGIWIAATLLVSACGGANLGPAIGGHGSEPATLVGGTFYPPVLEGQIFSAIRQTDEGGPGIPGLSAPIGPLRQVGYGVISIDQAGHGETGGTIGVMDPDQAGRFLVALLDWLEVNPDWYATGPLHILYFQGFRDTLFDFTEAWRNNTCFKDLGGDVRLFSHQGGHHTLQVVPDPGALINDTLGSLDFNGGAVNVDVAAIAWFGEHLKGITGAADAVIGSAKVCLSLSAGDAIFTDRVVAGRAGTPFTVSATVALAGAGLLPRVIPRYTAGEQAGLLIYGLHEQYLATGGINLANPTVGLVSLEGDAWLPILGDTKE